MPKQLYRRPEVETLTGLSRTSIYRLMERGEFPRPVRITAKAVAWREADLSQWLDSLTVTAA